MSDDSLLPDERMARAFGRFLVDIQERAAAGLAHPDRSGADRALRDIYSAAGEIIAELVSAEADDLSLDGPYGHCDTCGALCDEHGCTVDRGHIAAFDPLELCGVDGCSYFPEDVEDLAEHRRLNHPLSPRTAHVVSDHHQGDGPRGEEEA